MRLRPLNAARHLGAGQRLADHGDRGRHHVDEGARDLVDFRPDVGAEKRGRGEIERELLHRGIKQHRPRLRPPLRHPRRDAAIERRQIGFHRSGFEGDRKRAPVQAMLLEIEQHQSARKQQPENPAPAMGGGELLGLVEQHQLVGVGPEQHEAGFAEDMAAIDQPVFGRLPFDVSLRIGEGVERLADDGPAFVARNMRERVAFRRREGDRRGSHILHRHGNCSGWFQNMSAVAASMTHGGK